MTTARKIIVHIATSADGYIARPDGDVDWLNRLPKTADHGMRKFYSTIDTILWGRKTYDWLLAYQKKNGSAENMFKGVINYVFSQNPPADPLSGFVFATEPVKLFAQRLRSEPGKHIWMMGGGGLIASFLDAGEIDEFDIHVMPVFIGEGIPLIAPRHREVPLRLLSSDRFEDGAVSLHYEIVR